jgi:DNA-binding NarL/FixJ family response regulator
MLSVMVCIQTRIYRDGLVSALTSQSGIAVVTTCASMGQLLKLPASEWSDVALVDVQSDKGAKDAIDIIRRTHEACGRCAIVALGMDNDDDAIASLLEAGAAGYVTTGDSVEDLVRVLFAASSGELCCTPRVMRMVQMRLLQASGSDSGLRHARLASLSRREKQVLELVSLGRSNKEIARELCLEVATVKNHVHNVISKLQVRTRQEAVSVVGAA